jgi:hypothetical protein
MIKADAPSPSGASEGDRRLTRSREADDISIAAFEQHPKLRFRAREPFALRSYSDLRCYMTQAQHYYFQADQAKRLARQVADSEVREKLLEMAGEYRRYAELMEAGERPFEQALG